MSNYFQQDQQTQNESFSLEKENEKQTKKKSTRSRPAVNSILEELCEYEIPVGLIKNGYTIGGFYGQNNDGTLICFFNEDNQLIGINHLNKQFEINDISDLVAANGKAYEFYVKQNQQYDIFESKWLKLLHREFNIIGKLVSK